MGAKEVTAIIFIVVGGILILLGYLIGTRKQLSLIAGFDPTRFTDPELLAKMLGNALSNLGIIDAASGVIMFTLTMQTRWFILVFVIVNALSAMAIIAQVRRLMK